MTEGPGPDGVTHRCTLLTQGVHPTLFMLGLINSLRKFPGPQVLTAWSRLTFGVSPSMGRSELCPEPHPVPLSKIQSPRGTNSIMAMGPAGGQYSPTPLRRNGFQLGGGVRQRTSHRKLALLRSGWDFLFGHLPGDSIPPPHSRPDWKNRHPLCAFRQVSFYWGGSFYWGAHWIFHKTKNDPSGSP